MKTTILFIVLLFSSFNSFSQDFKEKNEGFFFKTEVDSLGHCYGRSLIQAEWDTLEKVGIVYHGYTTLKSKIYYDYDTIRTNYYFLEKRNIENLKYLLEFTDSLSQEIVLSKEERRLKVFGDNPETVTEHYAYREEFEYWNCLDFDKIDNSDFWRKDSIGPLYMQRQKRIIRTGGYTKEVVVPARYETIIKLRPKKNISNHGLNSIKLLCKDFYLERIKKYNIDTVFVPAITEPLTELKLIRPSRIEYRKIICELELNLIAEIQKKLFALGFYDGDFQGELDNKTREAIIRFQMKSNLPIGQLDEETVSEIIGKKTRFYP